MTLYEVIHGVAFAQAFNFYMQQRSLIPPGTLNDGYNSRIAFAQDLEAAQEYAHTQANLAWAFYQKVTPGPIYNWGDEDTNPYSGEREGHLHAAITREDGKQSGTRPVVTRSFVPPPPPPRPATVPPPLGNTVRRDPHLKQTVRVPCVRIPTAIDPREWRNDEEPPAGTFPY